MFREATVDVTQCWIASVLSLVFPEVTKLLLVREGWGRKTTPNLSSKQVELDCFKFTLKKNAQAELQWVNSLVKIFSCPRGWSWECSSTAPWRYYNAKAVTKPALNKVIVGISVRLPRHALSLDQYTNGHDLNMNAIDDHCWPNEK